MPENPYNRLLSRLRLLAVYALVARGVGPDTAARILRNLHETEDDFLRDLLAAEVNYARTRRFWD